MADLQEAMAELQRAGKVEQDERLSRSLGFWQYVALNIGAIIGAGWLFASLGAASFAGGIESLIAWAIDGVLVIFMALSYAYLAGLLPRSGAVVRYPQLVHGDLVGFTVGFLYMISIGSLLPAEAVAVVQYASYYIPGLVRTATVLGQPVVVPDTRGLLLALAIVALTYVVNYYGVRLVGSVSLGLMVWKVAVPLITIAALLVLAFKPSNLFLGGVTDASQDYHVTGLAAAMMAIPLTGIAYASLGFRQAIEYSGEGRSSGRDVPKAVVVSVLFSLAIFVLLQVAFVGAIDWSKIHPLATLSSGKTVILSNETLSPGSWAALSTSSIASAPIASELAMAGLGALNVLLIIDAWVSPLGNAIIQMGNLARIVYGVAANGHLPRRFSSLNRYAVPGIGLAMALGLGLLFLVPLPSWYAIGSYALLTTLLTYVTGGTVLGVLAVRVTHDRRYLIIALLGSVSAALLAYWAGVLAMMPVFATFVVALAAMLVIRARSLGDRRLMAVSITYAAVEAVLVGIMLTLDFYPLSSGLNVGIAEVEATFTIAIAGTAVATALALYAAHRLGNREMRAAVRSGAWYVGLIIGIMAVDALGPFGLAPLLGGDPPLAFPYDLIVMAAVAATAFAVSVLTSDLRRLRPKGNL